MHFIALCVAIIALACLPRALEVAEAILLALVKLLGYLLLTAGSIAFFVWVL